MYMLVVVGSGGYVRDCVMTPFSFSHEKDLYSSSDGLERLVEVREGEEEGEEDGVR